MKALIPEKLPPRPADGGGMPTTEDGVRARIRNMPDVLLAATLEREEQSERRLLTHLDIVQTKVRLIREEVERRARI